VFLFDYLCVTYRKYDIMQNCVVVNYKKSPMSYYELINILFLHLLYDDLDK